MKPQFSIGDAISAPFVLIRQRPLSVFVWGALMVGVVVAIYSLLIPVILVLPWGQREAAIEAYTGEMLELQAASNGLSLLVYLVMLVVLNAAGRAVLAPGRGDAFAFMRIGMDELRVAVVVVAAFLGWYIALLVLILLGVGLGLALWSVGEGIAIAALIVYGVLVLIAAIIAWVRVSLMGPATLILGRFAFAEGWAIARGQVLKLIGLNLLLWLLNVLIYVVVILIVGAIVLGGFFGQGLSWPEVVETPQDLMPLVRPMLLPLLATLPIFAFAYGSFIALTAAASIRAARQLLDGVPVARDAAGAHTLDTPQDRTDGGIR